MTLILLHNEEVKVRVLFCRNGVSHQRDDPIAFGRGPKYGNKQKMMHVYKILKLGNSLFSYLCCG